MGRGHFEINGGRSLVGRPEAWKAGVWTYFVPFQCKKPSRARTDPTQGKGEAEADQPASLPLRSQREAGEGRVTALGVCRLDSHPPSYQL